MELIDRERLKKDLIDNYSFYPVIVKNALEKQPVVEIVRCVECEYWKDRKVNGNGFTICPASGMEIQENDFCSYGERREENAAD